MPNILTMPNMPTMPNIPSFIKLCLILLYIQNNHQKNEIAIEEEIF